jgi:hypothetical protein
MIPQKVSVITCRVSALCFASLCALALIPANLCAQQPDSDDEPIVKPAPPPPTPVPPPPPPGPTISVRILDGRTGKPIIPSNVLLHVDHHDALSNEGGVKMGDENSITVTPPHGSSVIALQGTYENSYAIYINCDAAADSNTDKLYWYTISEIVSTGVVAPNKCSVGVQGIRGIKKRAPLPEATAKPGEFVFFVRPRNHRDTPAN